MTWRGCKCECHPHAEGKQTKPGCCRCCPEFKRCSKAGAHPAHYFEDRRGGGLIVYLCGSV